LIFKITVTATETPKKLKSVTVTETVTEKSQTEMTLNQITHSRSAYE